MENMMTVQRRFISATLLAIYMLIVCGVTRADAQEPARFHLSDEDKIEIVESVLQQELKAQGSEFKSITNLSAENIEFIEASKISNLGLTLISAAYVRERKKDNVIEYVVFKRIEAKGGKVIVVLSRMLEGRPCFGHSFSNDRDFIYEYHRESGDWRGELIKKVASFVVR